MREINTDELQAQIEADIESGEFEEFLSGDVINPTEESLMRVRAILCEAIIEEAAEFDDHFYVETIADRVDLLNSCLGYIQRQLKLARRIN